MIFMYQYNDLIKDISRQSYLSLYNHKKWICDLGFNFWGILLTYLLLVVSQTCHVRLLVRISPLQV